MFERNHGPCEAGLTPSRCRKYICGLLSVAESLVYVQPNPFPGYVQKRSEQDPTLRPAASPVRAIARRRPLPSVSRTVRRPWRLPWSMKQRAMAGHHISTPVDHHQSSVLSPHIRTFQATDLRHHLLTPAENEGIMLRGLFFTHQIKCCAPRSWIACHTTIIRLNRSSYSC